MDSNYLKGLGEAAKKALGKLKVEPNSDKQAEALAVQLQTDASKHLKDTALSYAARKKEMEKSGEPKTGMRPGVAAFKSGGETDTHSENVDKYGVDATQAMESKARADENSAPISAADNEVAQRMQQAAIAQKYMDRERARQAAQPAAATPEDSGYTHMAGQADGGQAGNNLKASAAYFIAQAKKHGIQHFADGDGPVVAADDPNALPNSGPAPDQDSPGAIEAYEQSGGKSGYIPDKPDATAPSPEDVAAGTKVADQVSKVGLAGTGVQADKDALPANAGEDTVLDTATNNINKDLKSRDDAVTAVGKAEQQSAQEAADTAAKVQQIAAHEKLLVANDADKALAAKQAAVTSATSSDIDASSPGLGGAIAIAIGGLAQGLQHLKSNPVLDAITTMSEAIAKKRHLDQQGQLMVQNKLLEQAKIKIEQQSANTANQQVQLGTKRLAFEMTQADRTWSQQANMFAFSHKPEFTAQESLYLPKEDAERLIPTPKGTFFQVATAADAKQFKDAFGPQADALKQMSIMQNLINNRTEIDALSLPQRQEITTRMQSTIGDLRQTVLKGARGLSDQQLNYFEKMLGDPNGLVAIVNDSAAKKALQTSRDIVSSNVQDAYLRLGYNAGPTQSQIQQQTNDAVTKKYGLKPGSVQAIRDRNGK